MINLIWILILAQIEIHILQQYLQYFGYYLQSIYVCSLELTAKELTMTLAEAQRCCAKAGKRFVQRAASPSSSSGSCSGKTSGSCEDTFGADPSVSVTCKRSLFYVVYVHPRNITSYVRVFRRIRRYI